MIIKVIDYNTSIIVIIAYDLRFQGHRILTLNLRLADYTYC